MPVLFTDYAAADAILRFEAVTGRAVNAGALDSRLAAEWLGRLRRGPFLAAFTFFIVAMERPA